MLHQARSGFAVLEAVISSPNNWRSGFGAILLDAQWLRSEAGRASTHRIPFEMASEQPFRVHSGFEVASEQFFWMRSGFEVALKQPEQAHTGFRVHNGFEVTSEQPF